MTRIWKYNNLLLNEKKDHIIKKLYSEYGNITEDEMDELLGLFKRNPQFENLIDWNKKDSLTFEDFEFLFKKEKDTQARVELLGKGVRNLKEGKDYIFLGSGNFKGEDWVAVQPLTYYSSRVLASKDVGPAIDARWCIAWQKDRSQWDKHCIKNRESMIFLMGESIPSKKVCITPTLEDSGYDYNGVKYLRKYNGRFYNIWDSNDKRRTITIRDLPKEFYDFIEKSLDNISLVDKYHDEDVKKTEEILNKEGFKEFLKTLTYNPETKRYDCEGNIHLSYLKNNPYVIKNGKLQIKFGVVKGNFICEWSPITTLEGAPTYVGGFFNCNSCKSLTKLEGCPTHIDGSFNCRNCTSLTSLEGAPREVGWSFSCSSCDSLTSLEGAPKYVGGDFDCSYCDSLTSLNGAPREVGGSFSCYKCNSLESLEGAPEKVGGSFICESCISLTSLEGAPREVGFFNCSHCVALKSLKGAPIKVNYDFNCSDCVSLTSLEGAPESVRIFDCSRCSSLGYLKGGPKYISQYLKCVGCTYLPDFSDAYRIRKRY